MNTIYVITGSILLSVILILFVYFIFKEEEIQTDEKLLDLAGQGKKHFDFQNDKYRAEKFCELLNKNNYKAKWYYSASLNDGSSYCVEIL